MALKKAFFLFSELMPIRVNMSYTEKRLACRLFSKKMRIYGMNPVNVPRAKIAFPVSSESNM